MNSAILIIGLCVVLTIIRNVSGSDIDDTNYNRVRRQAKCGFQCKNGQCIEEHLECDGIDHCEDGSDETEHCHDVVCPDTSFRCKYGACIDKVKVCNGETNCKDSSDEIHCSGGKP